MIGPELDAAIAHRQASCHTDRPLRLVRRETVVVGRIEPKVARRCGWCRQYHTEADRERAEAGHPISDGICEPCRARCFPDLPPAA